MKKAKNNWHILLSVILITSALIVLIAYISGAVFSDLENIPLVGTQDGWLSLWGALGGGAMTLYGVWWTIKDQDDNRRRADEKQYYERKQQLSFEYKPTLTLEGVDIKDKKEHTLTPDIEAMIIFGNHELMSKSLTITLINSGRGEAVIESVSCDFMKELNTFNNIKILPPNAPMVKNVIPAKDKILVKLIPSTWDTTEIGHSAIAFLSIKYADFLHNQHYITDILISIQINSAIKINSMNIINYRDSFMTFPKVKEQIFEL